MSFNYTDAFVTIAAIDFEVLIQFYRQLLGQNPDPYLPQVYAEFRLNSLRLGIFKPKQSHQSEFAVSAGSGISLCLEMEDLESAIAYLNAMGYPPPGNITTTSYGREIYAYDPAGNRLILYQSKESYSKLQVY